MDLQKAKNEKGITLIALAVTIVVLLILAGVSLNAVFGENGIIKYASSAGDKMQMQAIREQVETVKLDWEMNKKIDQNTTVSDFFKALETAGIIDSATENVEQGKTEQKEGFTETEYTITTKDGYDINITLTTTEDGKTEITITEVVSNANALPRVEIKSLEATTNSITVKVDVRRQTGKLIYSYRVVGTSDYTTAAETEDTTVEITGLKTNTVYEIKVEAKNANGSSYATKGVTTGELASGTIKFGDQVWNNGTATITLTTTSSYQMQYQIGATEENGWILYNAETGITNLQHGQTVYARIFDGVNGSEEASISILDDVAPTVTISSNITKTTKSITVSVTSSDSESGMPSAPVYYFYIKKSTESEFKTDSTGMVNGVGANTATSYTFNNLEDGISYDVKVTVFDNAKNEGTVTKTGITTEKITGASADLKTGSIIASTPTWSNGTASLNLSTDTGLTIQYQIGSISESGWQNYNSSIGITGLSHNTTVYARLTDGQNNGDEASVKIQDGVAPSTKITATTAYNITSGTTTTISATVTQTDSESGINISNCKYIFNNSVATLGTNASSYTDGIFSSTSQSVSKTVSKGTWYLHVLTVDNAGNAIETISNAITVTQKVTGISLNQTSAEMNPEDTLTLTATVTPNTANNTAVNWSSSNTSIATVNSNGLVTAKSAGNVTITATAADGSGKTASCSITVSDPTISKEESFVGYFADIDGNGTVDGVIYADLAVGGSGQWYNSNGTYSYSAVEDKSTLKNYVISQESYTVEGATGYGTKPVLKANGTGGTKDRFYVMALSDVTNSGTSSSVYFTWYDAAYDSGISEYASITSTAFGAGKNNTTVMINSWNGTAYGAQNDRSGYLDMWGVIQDECSGKWFVPSKEEWCAFAKNLEITSSNYGNFGLSHWYWSSSLANAKGAWLANFDSGYMRNYHLDYDLYDRLSATF